MDAADSELVAASNGATVLEMNFQNLLTAHLATFLIRQTGDDCLGCHLDNFAGRRKSELSIHGERDPAGLVAQGDAVNLFWGHDGGIEDMNVAVGAIREPDFLFIGSQSNAMTGASMSFDRSFGKSLDFNPMKEFTGLKIADFKAQEIVHIDEAKGLAAIDGERADAVGKGADLSAGGVVVGAGHC